MQYTIGYDSETGEWVADAGGEVRTFATAPEAGAWLGAQIQADAADDAGARP